MRSSFETPSAKVLQIGGSSSLQLKLDLHKQRTAIKKDMVQLELVHNFVQHEVHVMSNSQRLNFNTVAYHTCSK
jgi:hypothetical protein